MHISAIQEVDLYMSGEFSLDKAHHIDISVPIVYDDVEIMIPYPKKRGNSRGLYEIYSPTAIFRFMFLLLIIEH